MTGKELIDGLVGITAENISFVEKKVGYLSSDQLNWKPNPNVWSLNEIFAHLNEYAAFYHPAFKRVISKTKFRKPTQNFISTPLGSAAWKSIKLGKANNVKRTFKAQANYNPTINANLTNGQDSIDFLKGQNNLLQILESAKAINIKRAKSPISISKIIKFRLGDALNFVIYHNQRHIQQAKNLMNHSEFPKKK